MKKLTKKAAEMTTKELAAYIDYSVLKPEFTEEQIIELTKSKVEQIEDVAKYDTVKEVDVVANFGHIRAGKYEKVTADIKACADAAHKFGRELKVIFETDALTEEQVRKACHCAMDAGADFVKTSTGFLTGYEAHGATPEIIKVMQEEVGDKCKVKGSGCIRTREHFLQLIDMGIDRMLSCGHATARKIGEQAGAKIVIGRRVLYSVEKVKNYLSYLEE